ncbi:glucosamine-6-phosphate deaminase [Clostridium hydrogeniformans]|uniref:glucosamine-6-phosphate deaminase n=1 Tax=Clostridium hydrogeniformans TaxID=349933 RepID=UPI00048262C8|nr:glucosamine-6-phosphate deaminase [Clostridium hydrogeniformans]
MRIIIEKDYEAMSKKSAEILAEVVNEKPEAVLGLATGGTPVSMYRNLIDMNKEGKIDFSKVTSVNLDEYKGLSGDHDQSYRYFMNNNLFNHINIDKKNTYVPNGLAEDIEKECSEYDKRIENLGGIDLQLLGIGNNGHIGFNEPDDFLHMSTHLTGLTEGTIEANARFFDKKEDVPTEAITMGLGGIMKAKKILLIASGENKAEIISKLVEGKITTQVPATLLQVHPNVTIVVDEAAASLLKK